MSDDRINYLIVLKDNPDIMDSLDIIKICNKFVNAISYTNRRLSIFSKFEKEDLNSYNFEACETMHTYLESNKGINIDEAYDEDADFAINGNITDEKETDVDDENYLLSIIEDDILIEEI